jgi:hypothetical protein
MRSVGLLLWRNCVRRRRAKCASVVELLAPIVVVALFSGLFLAFSNKDHAAAQYVRDRATSQPLAGFGYRLQLYNAELGLGA